MNLPVAQEPLTTKGCFQFRAPTRVFLGGSVPLNTCVQPGKVADLFMEMPKVRLCKVVYHCLITNFRFLFQLMCLVVSLLLLNAHVRLLLIVLPYVSLFVIFEALWLCSLFSKGQIERLCDAYSFYHT